MNALTIPGLKKNTFVSFIKVDGEWKQTIVFTNAKGTEVIQFRKVTAKTLARIEKALAPVAIETRELVAA